MTVKELAESLLTYTDALDYDIYVSSDEEGNSFCQVDTGIGMDDENKQLTLYPDESKRFDPYG